MPEPDLSAATAPEPLPAGLAEAGVYRTQREGFDHGLVVLAMGEGYWLVPDATGEHVRLLVETRALAGVREQLAAFDRESVDWPPRPVLVSPSARKTIPLAPLLWCLTVLAVFWAQGKWPGLSEAGALDSRAVFGGREWWRLGTALFLHADLGHVMSNALSGIFVFSAVVSALGGRRGWFLLALASVAGNLAVAAMYYPSDYRSLGASTAIFAGLGLLTGRAIREVAGSDRRRRWRVLLVPLATGVTVLGLYGAGGWRVDVIAHTTGFISGLVLGVSGTGQHGSRRTPDAAG